MKIKLSLILLFVLVTLNSLAQTQPPIFSQDRLRIAALNGVVGGSRYVWSHGIYYDAGSLTSTNMTGSAGAEDLLTRLIAAPFRYSIVNSNDPIYGYVYLYDACSTLTWFGYAEYTAAELMAGHKPVYNLYMQYQPILENVDWAEVIAFDEDGETGRHYSLELSECDNLLWPPWMSGLSNATLVVHFKNGSNVTYQASNPIPTSLAKSSENPGFQIEGHYIYKVNSATNIQVLEESHRPTVLLEVTGTQRAVTLDIQMLLRDQNGQPYLVRPTDVVVTQVGQDEGPASFTLPMAPDQPSTFLFSYTARLRFLWPFGTQGTLYAGPDYYGKGEAAPEKRGEINP